MKGKDAEEGKVDPIQRKQTRENRRTVASASLLPEATVDQNAEERKRRGQRQDDKGIPSALVCKHCEAR